MQVRDGWRKRLVAGATSLGVGFAALVAFSAPAVAGGAASIADATVVEGNGGGTTNLVFTVSNPGVAGQCGLFRLTVTPGTATTPADYTSSGPFHIVYFAAGAGGTRTVSIPVVSDGTDENDETVTATLENFNGGGCTPADITDGTATGTIVDDDTASASIDDVTHTEGTPPPAGSTEYGFTVDLSAPSSVNTSLSWAVAHGSTDAADFTATTSGTVNFLAGQTSKPVLVRVSHDALNEADETFNVVLSNPAATPPGPAPVIGDGSGLGTITNDDAPVTLSVADATANEGDDVNFTVTLSAAAGQAITAQYATTNGTATAPGDFTSSSGTLTIPAGSTSGTISVPTTEDGDTEPHENFTLTLSNPAAVTIVDGVATGTILDDDGVPVVHFAEPVAGHFEGNAAVVRSITVLLSAPALTDVVVDYEVVDCPPGCPGGIAATAGVDFVAVPAGTLTIPAGQTSATFGVTILPDNIQEPIEAVQMRLLAVSGATISPTVGTSRLGIISNDSIPTVAIDDLPAITEGDAGTSVATFAVTLSNPHLDDMFVNFATTDGSATAADDDYVATAGTLTFPAGTTARTVSVTINGDVEHELNESFDVVLSNFRGFNGVTVTTGILYFLGIADSRGLGTIINDDEPAPIVNVADAEVVEGNAGQSDMVFTITLESTSDLAVSGLLSTANGSATAGTDYSAATNAPWSIPAGSTSTTVTVAVTGDTSFEPDETFAATLSGLVNGGGGDLQATGRVLNDDLPVARVNDPVAVTEGTGAGTTNLTFTVSLDGPAQAPGNVTAATTDGTATAPGDYNAISPTVVSFAPGEQSKNVTVTITRDNLDEATESFTLDLSAPSGLIIGDGSGTGTITDDDAVPAPVITGLVPSSGPSVGGTQVTIVGHNLATATQVTINNQPVAFVVSGTVLVFTTPASLPGTATVLVTTPGGTSAPNPASTFTYQ